MIIKRIDYAHIADYRQFDVDLLICSCGYEQRSSHLAKKISMDRIVNKIVLGFKENRDKHSRRSNDKAYSELGFDFFIVSESSGDEIELIIMKEIEKINKNIVTIIIDITSMTGCWYGAIVKFLKYSNIKKHIITYFTYIPAVFKKLSEEYPPNQFVSPFKGFAGLGLADKAPALIIGVGRDAGRSEGLKDYIDPKTVYAFCALPGIDERYDMEIYKVNKDLFGRMLGENILVYDLSDPITLYSKIESLCDLLIRDYRVILASLGPKIFGLICFILTVKYPEISVWRVSAGEKRNIINHKASNESVTIKVEWQTSNSYELL